VDRFHEKAAHTGEKTAVAQFCNRYCNYEEVDYPGLQDESGTSLGNSEAAEQTFSRFVNFGSMMMNMTLVNQYFFLYCISETVNNIATWECHGNGIKFVPARRPAI